MRRPRLREIERQWQERAKGAESAKGRGRAWSRCHLASSFNGIRSLCHSINTPLHVMLHAIVILVGPYPLVCAAREPKLPRVRIAPVALRGDLNLARIDGSAGRSGLKRCGRGLRLIHSGTEGRCAHAAIIDAGRPQRYDRSHPPGANKEIAPHHAPRRRWHEAKSH